MQAACKRAPRLAPTCLVNGPIPRGRVIIPGPPAVPGAHAVGGCRCPGPSAGPWHPLSSSSPPALAWPTQVLVLGGPWPSCVCAPLAWDLALCPLLPPLQVRAQPRSDPDPEPAPRPRRSRPHFSPRLPGPPPQPSLEKLDGAQRGHRPGKLWSRLRSRPRGAGDPAQASALPRELVLWVPEGWAPGETPQQPRRPAGWWARGESGAGLPETWAHGALCGRPGRTARRVTASGFPPPTGTVGPGGPPINRAGRAPRTLTRAPPTRSSPLGLFL